MKSKDQRVTLKVEKHEKDLGITVDTDLSFKKHIAEIVKKANQRLGMIKRGFRYLDKNILCQLYKTMIRPILETGNVVWKPNAVMQIKSIEKVQRRATNSYQH